MNMEHVTKVNGVICPVIKETKAGLIVKMHGRTKTVYPKSSKVVENHTLTGRFLSLLIKRR